MLSLSLSVILSEKIPRLTRIREEMNIPIVDFPKLKSPFIRKRNDAGDYVVTPEIEPGYEWLFDNGVVAVDKLHGTNISINVTDKMLDCIDNRTTRMMMCGMIPMTGNSCKFLIGVMNAANRWQLEDGCHFGELIGPDINGNLHGADEYLFVPFHYLRSKCQWHSWVKNQYPKDFDSISEWFKELPSLFSKRIYDKDVLAEGLIFYHPDGRMCKLRRDMFEWYKGERHKE